MSADSLGNIYVTGANHTDGIDAFLSKFDALEILLWTQQLDTSIPSAVSADGKGNVYLSSSNSGDIFLAKIIDIAASAGDFDLNGELNAADVDLLSAAVRDGVYDEGFDLNLDTLLDQEDRRVWVEELAKTYFGDADLNGTVDFGDFVLLANAYGTAGGWAMGDFDGDGVVQFSDFVLLADNFGKSAEAFAAIP